MAGATLRSKSFTGQITGVRLAARDWSIPIGPPAHDTSPGHTTYPRLADTTLFATELGTLSNMCQESQIRVQLKVIPNSPSYEYRFFRYLDDGDLDNTVVHFAEHQEQVLSKSFREIWAYMRTRPNVARAFSLEDENKMFADMNLPMHDFEPSEQKETTATKRKVQSLEQAVINYKHRVKRGKSKLGIANQQVGVVGDKLVDLQNQLLCEQERLKIAKNDWTLTKDRLLVETSRLESLREQYDESENEQCRVTTAQHLCWCSKEYIYKTDILALNEQDEHGVENVDGITLPSKMQCNGGHTICADCSEGLAENFLLDQQKNRMCCGYITSWPGGRHSKPCNKLYSNQQMGSVLPPETVLKIETQSVLRHERAIVATRSSQIGTPSAAQAERDDEIFIFKTPCCNRAWMADACMAVNCESCNRWSCQLCSRRMEHGMSRQHAHDHVRQCTHQFFRRSFLYPTEIDECLLPCATVHAVMKSNNIKMFQLRSFGAERLSHPNMAEDEPTDIIELSSAERRDALDIKISEVVANLATINEEPTQADLFADELMDPEADALYSDNGESDDELDNDTDDNDGREEMFLAPRDNLPRRAAEQGRTNALRNQQVDMHLDQMLRG